METVVGALKPLETAEIAQMTLFRPFSAILAIPAILAQTTLFYHGDIDFLYSIFPK